MCGRYALYGPISRLSERFAASIDALPADFGPRYNAAPMQMLPVVRQRPGGERVAHLLRWGLLPGWAKDPGIATRLINARAETLAEKPAFRAAYRARRCIVPASGFYEWKAVPGGKQPYYIQPANDELFGLAGLWERWTRPEGTPIDTFTVITTAANATMQALHERMPVILQPADYGPWLSRDTAPERLGQLLAPCPDGMLSMHPVSKAVGNVRNEGARLIAPESDPQPR
ncbi:MAG: SOS response-associated peptidase [Thauera sp.]|uniref:SOS response-associated peptidase n=1 Tax=Thauera sp. JM12B12 TaxID=3142262 RepID=UPI0029C1E4C5|nr:SOS response-associated peptidase [Thauera sp.]